jgi:hypothetical protein
MREFMQTKQCVKSTVLGLQSSECLLCTLQILRQYYCRVKTLLPQASSSSS